jgi:uncharacterized protein (TIGR03067 family)
MSKLLALVVVAAAAAFLFVSPAVAVEDNKDLKLEGQFTVVSAEKDGQALAQNEVTGKTVRITADKLTVMNKDGKEEHTCTYTLDTSKTPATIRTKGTGSEEGKNHVGLVEQTRDGEIKIILADGTQFPTEFKTKQGQMMWTLKKQ